MERNETRLASPSFSAMLHHSLVLNATLAGRAPSSHALAKETLTFQSAYPRGTQHPTQFRDTTWNGCFNPRARVGRDTRYIRLPVAGSWFQSTRLREARRCGLCQAPATWGGFNPRACVRRDHGKDVVHEIDMEFQSTRLREARLTGTFVPNVNRVVSIHAPA